MNTTLEKDIIRACGYKPVQEMTAQAIGRVIDKISERLKRLNNYQHSNDSQLLGDELANGIERAVALKNYLLQQQIAAQNDSQIEVQKPEEIK